MSSRSIASSAAHVDQHPTIPPPARGPLGLVLLPSPDSAKDITQLDLASLLLTALNPDELDPVCGILHCVNEDVEAVAMALHYSREDLGSAFNTFLNFVARRVQVANELHRRMLVEAQEATRAGAEGGSR